MTDFFNKFYAQAVRATPYSEIWHHVDGRILGLVNGVFHEIPSIPAGFYLNVIHPMDENVWIYRPNTRG